MNSLNDDGNLYRKFRRKRAQAKQMKIEFKLNYEDWCFLVAEAGLRSSDLGFSGKNYVLARYGDEGPYEVGNCRFTTQQQNVLERKISDKMRSASAQLTKYGTAANVARGKRTRIAFEATAHSSYLNERNSQYGTRWITDGSTNRKIRSSDPIPEGFKPGRVGQGLNLMNRKRKTQFP